MPDPALKAYLRVCGLDEPQLAWLDRCSFPSERTDAAALKPSDPSRMLGNTAQSLAPSAESEARTIEELEREARNCRRCRLAETRTKVVFGSGNPKARLILIGEAPGGDEDRKGEPFVGKAGKLLDRMLLALGLDRSKVYILNTIKCRPPANRDPKPEEIEACSYWFERQMAFLDPAVIVLLGRVAARTVLGNDAPLAALRGRWHEWRGIPVRVTYHPAYLLRSPAQKRRGWEDLMETILRLRVETGG